MAKFNYGTDWLIDQVYRFESVASSAQTFDEEDIVQYLNTELQTVVTPLIQSVNEEFGVMYVDTPINELPDTIRIPSSATGARLRNVQIVFPNNTILNYPRLNPDKLGQFGYTQSLGFYIRNNELVFYPQRPIQQGVLRLSYFRRSNNLVRQIQTGRIIAVDTVGNTITMDNSPAGSEWVDGSFVDVIIGESPFDFRAQDAQIIDINGAVIELDPAVIAEVQVGDYVALSGETPVPQFVPAEALQWLAQLAGARCLQALGDTEGFKIAAAKAQVMEQNLKNLISDRIEGQPQRLSAVGLARRATFGWNYLY